VRTVRAVLFDLDGVLVDSREATERVWRDWAARNGIRMLNSDVLDLYERVAVGTPVVVER